MEILFVLVFLLVFYFVPTFIAWKRGNLSSLVIFLISLLIGGALVIIVWALTNTPQSTVSSNSTNKALKETASLAVLKEQGKLKEGINNVSSKR